MSVVLKQKFKVEITAPCGRANYEGGETILTHTKNPRLMVGSFMECFPGHLRLHDGDEVEISITVTKRKDGSI